MADENEDADRAELHHIYFSLPDGISTRATGPVATVGGVSVSAEAYHEQLGYFAGRSNEDGSMDDAINNALKKVIQRQLLRHAFAPDEAAIEAERARMRKRQEDEARERLGEDADLSMIRRPWETDPTFGRKRALDTLLAARAMEHLDMSLPTRQDALIYYEAHPNEFWAPALVESRALSTRDVAPDQDARQHILKLHRQVTAEDADIDALFERHRDPIFGLVSVTEEDAKNPELAPFAQVALDLGQGQISEPFEFQSMWIILWSYKRIEAGVLPFDRVEEHLLTRLRHEAREFARDVASAQLRDQIEVTIHWENLTQPEASE